MLDVGWSEMAVILLVALVVIGPKDLPRVARTVGKWTAKARGMAREFQRSLDDMAREAELQDIKAEMEKLSRTDVRQQLEETIDPDRTLRDGLEPPRIDQPRIDQPRIDQVRTDQARTDEPRKDGSPASAEPAPEVKHRAEPVTADGIPSPPAPEKS